MFGDFCQPNNYNYVSNMFANRCRDRFAGLDNYRFSVLLEMLMVRDNISDFFPNPGLFNKDDINMLIEFLCTD